MDRHPHIRVHGCMHTVVGVEGPGCPGYLDRWDGSSRPTHAGSDAMRIRPRDRLVWKTTGSPVVDLRCLEMLDNNAAPSVTSSHTEARLDVGDSPRVEEVSERPIDDTWFHMRCTAEVCVQVPCAIVAIR
mmetsp:Transcript_2797/g.17419  ORF Transcript_2797/g.17419 Transcript_2797/m.17419 type:complete len:130 (-) Transcript_2797:388-777(-)